MKNFVIINGVNSNTINGLGINELPPISKPSMRVQQEEIDGRDGDITTNLGYSAYDKTITIGLFGTGYDINNIISFFNGEGTITFSNEDDKYYKYKIINQIDYEALQKFKTASITFHCQPFKYPLTEIPLEIAYEYIEQDNVESATLNNTNGNTHLDISLKGNTSQEGTPTPDSPQPIHSVSGDNTIEVVGKNLAYTSWASDFVSRVSNTGQAKLETYDGKNCLLYQYSVGSGDYDNKYIFKTNWKENTQYTISYRLYANYSPNITIIYTDGTQTTIPRSSITINTWNNVSITSTANKTIKQIQGYAEGGYDYIDLDTFMVYEGTETIPYQPYQSQTLPINLPVENLFDGELELGYYSNSTGVKENATNLYRNKNIIKVKPSTTYTFSINGVSQKYVLLYYGTSQNFISSTTNLTTGTFTTPNNCYYINFRCFNADFTSDYATLKVQLEEGTKANSYTPYGTTPIELNKIGTYQDYFYKDSGKWYKKEQVGKTTDTSGSTGITINDMVNNGNIYSYYGGSVSGKTITYDSAISGTNTILYPKATATDTEITNSTLIGQLEAIKSAVSYDTQTNIFQTNNDKPFIMDLIAMKDGTDEVVVNNIGNIYSKPTIALEGTGDINIYLDGTQMLKATLTDKMTIDTNNLEAYNPDTMTLLNRQLVGDISKFTLASGNNTIKVDGNLTKATITNYERWL